MNIKELRLIALFLIMFILISQIVESKACEPAPSSTPTPTETPLLILQLVRGD